MENLKIEELNVEEKEQQQERTQSERDFYSTYSVDVRDEQNVVGVICKQIGYDLLVEKVGYSGLCDCFLGKKFTSEEILKIWSENQLVR